MVRYIIRELISSLACGLIGGLIVVAGIVISGGATS